MEGAREEKTGVPPVKREEHPLRSIFLYWVPMFGTWLIMAAEAPFVAAVIARMPDPKYNLAGFGVAYAVAMLVEAPVIMILSASTALVRGAESFTRLRRFTSVLNMSLTAVMLLLVLTPAWTQLATRVIGLPERVVELSRVGLFIMTLWPAAIGYRRFYQGLLIQAGRTRRVAWGTLTRLVTMAATSLVLLRYSSLPGAWVGAGGIAAGVFVEAIVSRIMAIHEVRDIRSREGETDPPDYAEIATFYWPLALTSLIGMAVHPMVTFFMGRGRFPLESLAVLPVVNSLTFIFRSIGLSYQEVAIALLGRKEADQSNVLRFAGWLAAGGTVAMCLIGFTPLSWVWFQKISGLSPELTRFALTPTRILCVIPALSVLLSMQRAVLVYGRRTGPITRATAIEVLGIFLVLGLLITEFDMVGATAAAISIVIGRVVGSLILVPPSRRVLSERLSN